LDNPVEQTNFIPTQKPVYWGLPAEKLGMPVEGTLPLQLGFYGNSKAGLPVTIHFKTASAPEQRIVAFAMSVSNSTAAGTPFGCVIRVKNVKFNPIIKAPACKCFSEFVERQPENFPVEIPALAAESPESLDCNSGVIFPGNGDYLPDDFANPVPDEIGFFGLQEQKASPGPATPLVGKRPQSGSPLHDILPSGPDVFSEVELLEDFSVAGQNCNRETLTVYIYPYDVISRFRDAFFAEIGHNLQAGGNAISFASPARCKERRIALVRPVFLDRNCNSLPGLQTELDKTPGFSSEMFTVPGNIEFDGQLFDRFTIDLNYVPFNIANDLRIEVGGLLAD